MLLERFGDPGPGCWVGVSGRDRDGLDELLSVGAGGHKRAKQQAGLKRVQEARGQQPSADEVAFRAGKSVVSRRTGPAPVREASTTGMAASFSSADTTPSKTERLGA